MPDQVAILAVLRGLHLAAALSLLGTVAFIAWVLPAAGSQGDAVTPSLIRLWRISGAIALVAGLAWFVLQAAVIAGAESWSDLGNALPVVAAHTRFGQTVAMRGIFLLVATLLAGSSRTRLYGGLLLVAGALCLQGVIGHAGAMEGRIGDGIVASEALHLIAAGLWLGALAPLWLTIGRLQPQSGALVCERFSPIGLGCVLVLAGTGLAQGFELIGSIPALAGTAYGQFALVKIALFVAALVLAAVNRLGLTDRLADGVAGARGTLRLSIVVEALTGLAIVLAAGFLASHSPGAHEQPVWPFRWRFSLTTVNEDSDFRSEVILSAMLIGLAFLVLALAILFGRFRLWALAILAGVIVLRGPSFTLLTVEAFPTSFQISPTAFSAASIVRGQAVFAGNCVSCHGATGHGDGPDASKLRIKPADLTMPHIWDHADGDMFWWMTHGIDDPEGGLAMPGFPQLLPDDRWALIDYVRALSAAAGLQRDEAFDVPVPAPALPLQCTGLVASTMADLRGSAVYVIANGSADLSMTMPSQAGVTVVTLDLRPGQGGAGVPNTCIAATPDAWTAYAVLADLPPADLAGSAFLVDPNGWLRALHKVNGSAGWQSPGALAATLRNICTNPLKPFSGGGHEHHH